MLLFLFLVPFWHLTVWIQAKEWRMANDALGNCERCSKKKVKDLLPQVRFVPRIVLGAISPPVTNICIQFMRLVYSCWMSVHGYRAPSGQRITWALSSVYPESGYGLCLAFMFSQRESVVPARQLCLNWSVLRKLKERAAPLIFNMFLWALICICFSELKQPSLDHCLLCYTHV